MYHHSNMSAASTGSGRRISTNNPFRSALLEEERARDITGLISGSGSGSGSGSPAVDDAQYKKWLNQKIEEEHEDSRRLSYDDDDASDSYDDDASSFTEGDEVPYDTRPRSNSRPTNYRTTSDNSMRNRDRDGRQRDSYNPFAIYARPDRHSNSNTPINTPNKPSFSNTEIESALPPADLVPPPAYDEVIGNKYAKDEYPKDEKNPFPNSGYSNSGEPRRAKTVSSRRPAVPPPPGQGTPHRLNPESMTNTTTTRIMPDGRIRSKSTGDPTREMRESRSSKEYNRHQSRSSRDDPNRHSSHHSQSQSHRHRPSEREHDRDYDKDHERDSDRPRRSGTRKSSKKFRQERSKNLDTIDRLDVTGFFGGGKFHHDGPFDACTPQRNKDTKAAPVAAFPADGPNNSIKGMAPASSKNEQYDMVFGIDKANDYDATYDEGSSKKVGSASATNRGGYTNGKVIQRADSADLVSLAPGVKQTLAQIDAGTTEKLYGDTTLGLGSSTFMDGAPAYGAKTSTSKDSSGLGRKKTLLGRMKTIVRK
jgi:hypothetical protein